MPVPIRPPHSHLSIQAGGLGSARAVPGQGSSLQTSWKTSVASSSPLHPMYVTGLCVALVLSMFLSVFVGFWPNQESGDQVSFLKAQHLFAFLR